MGSLADSQAESLRTKLRKDLLNLLEGVSINTTICLSQNNVLRNSSGQREEESRNRQGAYWTYQPLH